MIKSMLKIIKKVILTIMLFYTFSHATTVGLEAYIKASGVKPLNTTTMKVNGNVICPDGNDNSNTHPGCDMSYDTKFDNQNDTNPDNDIYGADNDMIVRTGDSFILEVTINANNGDLNEFKITSTLQSGVDIEWDELPDVCKDGSNISEDGLSMTCIRDDLASGSAEVLDFGVKVLDSALMEPNWMLLPLLSVVKIWILMLMSIQILRLRGILSV
jgi:hypothetical protein